MVECWYLGEVYIKDNIVVWVFSRKVLFGGCMLKVLGVGKGNLVDVNVEIWSVSMEVVKKRYLNLKLVIFGYGELGGMEFLDFIIKMFNN